MSMTLRSVTTPATASAAPGVPSSILKPKAHDIMPMNNGLDMLGSDSASYQMVASEANHGRVRLMDGLADAASRKAMSEHVT